MDVTVADILGIRDLALEIVAGQAGTGHTIRWVHVSELDDPTPWLRGGELLLTTGMGVGADPDSQRRYIERLVRAGLAGLGFGLGFSHEAVPAPLVEAADERGFALFVVPYAIPFIALTEAVFSRIAAGQYETLDRAVKAQRTLTRAVVEGGGVAGVVSTLAGAIGGWAVVVDTHGAVLAAAPPTARVHAPMLFDQTRKGVPHGLRFGASIVAAGSNVGIQPVGARGRVEAYLAVGRPQALGEFDHLVAGHALHLLAIELNKDRAVAETERRLKGDLLEALMKGGIPPAEAGRSLRRFGFDPSAGVSVIAAAGRRPVGELALAVEEALGGDVRGFLVSSAHDAVLALVEAGVVDLPVLQHQLSVRVGVDVMVAASRPAAPAEVATCVREARWGLEVCRMESRSTITFDGLGTYRLLLGPHEPDAVHAFTESVLGDVEAYDAAHGSQLVATLDAFLSNVGRWEATAAGLGIHRHTLRYRIQKVEELTGRSLLSAPDRTELWLALRARELTRSSSD